VKVKRPKQTHATQAKGLLSAINATCEAKSEAVLVSFEESSKLLLVWISLLRKNYMTKTADELLHAVSSSIREAAALASLGLVRPTLFALRAQADLLLSWIYFKDHPVEYRSLCRTGDGFVLKKEALKYFSDNFPGFGERLAILNSVTSRNDADIYRLLSAHVHSQSPFVIAEVHDLKDIVRSDGLVAECCSLQRDVSEYLSDILFSLGFLSEAALPKSIEEDLVARVKSAGQKKIIFG
jgi:hypothetical protein